MSEEGREIWEKQAGIARLRDLPGLELSDQLTRAQAS